MDKLSIKIIILLFALFILSFGLNVYLLTHNGNPVPDTETNDTETNDSVFVDSLAVLTARIDSMTAINAIQYQNLNYLRKVELQRQRDYYEKEIARVKHLSADSSLRLFTTYTDREWRHHGCGAD